MRDLVFVTVGNATQGFYRLLDAVDTLAGKSEFGNESVFIQSGNNPGFRPSYCKQEPFLSMEDFQAKVHESGLVICHAGAGTIIHVLQAGKIPVVMPRRKKYGEHVDDHQVELVKALASEGRVIPAYEPEDLPEAIEEAKRIRELGVRGVGITGKNRMIELVGKAIEEMLKRE